MNKPTAITQVQLLDVCNILTSYTTTTPTYNSDANGSVIGVLWSTEMDSESNPVLAIHLDVSKRLITAIESESYSYALFAKYTLSGIAQTHGFSFEVIETETVVTEEAYAIEQSTAKEETKDSAKSPTFH